MAELRNYLYLDIETVGTADPVEVADSIKPPGNIKKAETLADWEQNTKPELVKEALSKAGLRGETGRIICIGWAWNSESAVSICPASDTSERAVLTAAMLGMKAAKPTDSYKPIIVGHNVAGFDIRFLWQRAFVNGVRLPTWFPRDPKPWSDTIHDTMQMWDAKNFVGLDALCRAMGLPGKGNITGADVGGMWESGEYAAIAEYCRADVERVRAVHRKMLVSYGEVPAKQAYA